MYVTVVAAMVATVRKDMHTLPINSEEIMSESQRETRNIYRNSETILQDRTSQYVYGSSARFRYITSPQEDQVMSYDLLYKGSSSYMDKRQEDAAQIYKTPTLQWDSVRDSGELATMKATNGHVKERSESLHESRNITHKISFQQEMKSGTPQQFRNNDGKFTVTMNALTYGDMTTEFSHETTASGMISAGTRDQLQIKSGFQHKITLGRRNNTHQTSSKSIIGHRKMDLQHLLELLLYEDDELNKTIAEAWNYTAQLLSSGDLEIGQEAMNLTQQYMARRQRWIRYMQLFASNSRNMSDVLLRDGTSLVARFSELNEVGSILGKLQDIHRLVTLVKSDETNFCTYSDTRNYSACLSFILEAEEHLNNFEVAVHDMEKMQEKYNFKGYFMIPWNHSFHLVSERKSYLKTMNESINEDYIKALKKKELEEIFQYYVYPGIYLVILVPGVMGNGALLLMFVRYKEIRTAPNVMIFSLALADVTNLFANAPLYYVSKYYSQWIYFGGYGCRVFVTFRFLNHTVIELSVVALSAQRYYAVVTNLRRGSARCNSSVRSRSVIYILTVWLTALALALPPSIIFEFPNGVCFPFVRSQIVVKVLDIFYFVFFCFVLPVVLGVFSVMTARKLRQSVCNIPGEPRFRNQEIARYRSANVVTALAFSYAISHIPRSIWFFLVSFFHLNRREMKYIYIDEVTNYLIFSNSCLNPLALYITSGTFRRLFKRHLFCVQKNYWQQ
jgi:hypothetical protein